MGNSSKIIGELFYEKISVIVSCYNEEKSIKTLYNDIVTLILFFSGCRTMTNRIAKNIGIKAQNRQELLFLGCTSLMYIFPVFVAAQYDIIPFFLFWMALMRG